MPIGSNMSIKTISDEYRDIAKNIKKDSSVLDSIYNKLVKNSAKKYNYHHGGQTTDPDISKLREDVNNIVENLHEVMKLTTEQKENINTKLINEIIKLIEALEQCKSKDKTVENECECEKLISDIRYEIANLPIKVAGLLSLGKKNNDSNCDKRWNERYEQLQQEHKRIKEQLEKAIKDVEQNRNAGKDCTTEKTNIKELTSELENIKTQLRDCTEDKTPKNCDDAQKEAKAAEERAKAAEERAKTAEERAIAAAEEKAAEEKAKKEAVERAEAAAADRVAAQEKVKAAEKAKEEAEDKAKKSAEAAENARKEAEAKAKKEAAEREAAEKAKEEAEDKAKKSAEEAEREATERAEKEAAAVAERERAAKEVEERAAAEKLEKRTSTGQIKDDDKQSIHTLLQNFGVTGYVQVSTYPELVEFIKNFRKKLEEEYKQLDEENTRISTELDKLSSEYSEYKIPEKVSDETLASFTKMNETLEQLKANLETLKQRKEALDKSVTSLTALKNLSQNVKDNSQVQEQLTLNDEFANQVKELMTKIRETETKLVHVTEQRNNIQSGLGNNLKQPAPGLNASIDQLHKLSRERALMTFDVPGDSYLTDGQRGGVDISLAPDDRNKLLNTIYECYYITKTILSREYMLKLQDTKIDAGGFITDYIHRVKYVDIRDILSINGNKQDNDNLDDFVNNSTIIKKSDVAEQNLLREGIERVKNNFSSSDEYKKLVGILPNVIEADIVTVEIGNDHEAERISDKKNPIIISRLDIFKIIMRKPELLEETGLFKPLLSMISQTITYSYGFDNIIDKLRKNPTLINNIEVLNQKRGDTLSTFIRLRQNNPNVQNKRFYIGLGEDSKSMLVGFCPLHIKFYDNVLKDLFVTLSGNDKPDELENKMVPNVRMFVRSKNPKPTGNKQPKDVIVIGDYYIGFPKGSICKYFNKEGRPINSKMKLVLDGDNIKLIDTGSDEFITTIYHTKTNKRIVGDPSRDGYVKKDNVVVPYIGVDDDQLFAQERAGFQVCRYNLYYESNTDVDYIVCKMELDIYDRIVGNKYEHIEIDDKYVNRTDVLKNRKQKIEKTLEKITKRLEYYQINTPGVLTERKSKLRQDMQQQNNNFKILQSEIQKLERELKSRDKSIDRYENKIKTLNSTLSEISKLLQHSNLISEHNDTMNFPYDYSKQRYLRGITLSYDYNLMSGPFTKVYKPTESNINIYNSKEFQNLLGKIESGQNLTFVGYGASGSGKTSTLIYLDLPGIPKQDKMGIIVHLLSSDRLRDITKNITMKFSEIYLDNIDSAAQNYDDILKQVIIRGSDYNIGGSNPFGELKFSKGKDNKWLAQINKTGKRKKRQSTTKNVQRSHKAKQSGGVITNFKTDDARYIGEKNDKKKYIECIKQGKTHESCALPGHKRALFGETETIENVILKINQLREVNATSNNPVSTRAHGCFTLTCEYDDNFYKTKHDENDMFPKTYTIFVFDFAGVENKFTCDDPDTIKMFATIKQNPASNTTAYGEYTDKAAYELANYEQLKQRAIIEDNFKTMLENLGIVPGTKHNIICTTGKIGEYTYPELALMANDPNYLINAIKEKVGALVGGHKYVSDYSGKGDITGYNVDSIMSLCQSVIHSLQYTKEFFSTFLEKGIGFAGYDNKQIITAVNTSPQKDKYLKRIGASAHYKDDLRNGLKYWLLSNTLKLNNTNIQLPQTRSGNIGDSITNFINKTAREGGPNHHRHFINDAIMYAFYTLGTTINSINNYTNKVFDEASRTIDKTFGILGLIILVMYIRQGENRTSYLKYEAPTRVFGKSGSGDAIEPPGGVQNNFKEIIKIYTTKTTELTGDKKEDKTGHACENPTVAEETETKDKLIGLHLKTEKNDSQLGVELPRSETDIISEICRKRTAEGIVINNMLAKFREFVSIFIIIQKKIEKETTKFVGGGDIDMVPPFMAPCNVFQCSPFAEDCFGSIKINTILDRIQHFNGPTYIKKAEEYIKQVSSDKILDKGQQSHNENFNATVKIIANSLCTGCNGDRCSDCSQIFNMHMVLLCVVNLSVEKVTNNPPPTPYINLMPAYLKLEELIAFRNKEIPSEFKKNIAFYGNFHKPGNYTNMIYALGEPHNITDIQNYYDYKSNECDPLLWILSQAERDKISSFVGTLTKTQSSVNLDDKIKSLIGMIEYINKINAIHTMGTIEFMDNMKNYALTDMPCMIQLGNKNNKLINGTGDNINDRITKIKELLSDIRQRNSILLR